MNNVKVKFFNEGKGYGFIIDDGTQNEIFVHVPGLTEQIQEDDRVRFELIEGNKGMNAVNVKKID